MTEAANPHADALKYEDWGGEMGARWLANLKGFEGTIAPAGEALLARAAFAASKSEASAACRVGVEARVTQAEGSELDSWGSGSRGSAAPAQGRHPPRARSRQ